MADLSIFEKYPNSFRIDHPDFGDVSKTTYAKGVISDFKIDDPTDMVNTIHSQVKVTGDWGESDWIPLFFHPKAQYWDDDQHKATDFDQEKVNFERAWMSFRCDDEVAVMLREGVPVAVMGFADGLPRIGENVCRWERPPFYDGDTGPFFGFSQLLGSFTVGQDGRGADGKDLGLKTEAEVFEGGGPGISFPASYPERDNYGAIPGYDCVEDHSFFGSPPVDITWASACKYAATWGFAPDAAALQAAYDNVLAEAGAPGHWPVFSHIDGACGYRYWFYPGGVNNYKTRTYLVKVGPFIQAVFMLLRAATSPGGGGAFQVQSTDFIPGAQEWVDAINPLIHPPPIPESAYNVPPPVTGTFIAGQTPTVADDGTNWAAVDYREYHGLYTKDLYGELKNSTPPINVDKYNASFPVLFTEILEYLPLPR